MPRTRLDRYAKPAPDPMKVMILGNMEMQGKTADDMAGAMGISTNTFFARKKQPTTDWPLGQIIKAAAFLGIEQEDFRSAIRYSV